MHTDQGLEDALTLDGRSADTSRLFVLQERYAVILSIVRRFEILP